MRNQRTPQLNPVANLSKWHSRPSGLKALTCIYRTLENNSSAWYAAPFSPKDIHLTTTSPNHLTASQQNHQNQPLTKAPVPPPNTKPSSSNGPSKLLPEAKPPCHLSSRIKLITFPRKKRG